MKLFYLSLPIPSYSDLGNHWIIVLNVIHSILCLSVCWIIVLNVIPFYLSIYLMCVCFCVSLETPVIHRLDFLCLPFQFLCLCPVCFFLHLIFILLGYFPTFLQCFITFFIWIYHLGIVIDFHFCYIVFLFFPELNLISFLSAFGPFLFFNFEYVIQVT